MCKYCVKAYSTAADSPEFYQKDSEGFRISMALYENNIMSVFHYTDDYDNEAETIAYIPIHYCPFCGQKLDLVEVD